MPNDKQYNWRRLWIPRDQEIQTDGGYFYVLEGEWKKYSTSNAVSFEDLADKSCLVLLAEPGMGKSHVMKAACEFSKKRGDKTLFLDLRSVDSTTALDTQLFQDGAFREWEKGSHNLYVFLDSLDEALRHSSAVSKRLKDKFQNYDSSRLFLRIACRAAEWPQELEEALRHTWKNEPLAIYRLAPLQRCDVAEAAQANGLDSQNFLSEVARVRAEPLASKPITLKFLISTFPGEGKFPSSQTELYQNGCWILCQKANAEDRAGKLSAQEKMKIAGRIAVATIFGGFDRISLRPDLGDMPNGELTVAALCDFSDEHGVRESDIRETLETSGLFSPGGDGSVRWAHQTYAEFLAAWFINESKSPLSQIRSFLIAQDEKLFPQFRETATWLAAMRPDFAEHILQNDPSAVLQSDFALVDHAVRKSIAGKLLTMFDEGQLHDDFGQNYARLAHPGLAGQLKPYIADKTKRHLVRRAAVKIAEACGIQELQDMLADVALNQTEEYSIRIKSAYAVLRIANEETKKRFTPLALGEAGDDPRNDLRGIGLSAVWPLRAIDAERMFQSLTPPSWGYYGAYKRFLRHLGEGLNGSLTLEDLPIALEWSGSSVDDSDSTLEAQKQIFQLAIENIDAPGVMSAFAEAFFAKTKRYKNVPVQFPSTPEGTATRRRLFLELVKRFFNDPNILQAARNPFPLLFSDDASWIIERFECEDSREMKKAFAKFICAAFSTPDFNQYAEKYDEIVRLCDSHPILKEAFNAKILCPLDSWEKEHFERQQESQKLQEEEESFEQEKPHSIEKLLDDFDAGYLSAWVDITRLATSDKHHFPTDVSDLTIFPVWARLSEKTQSRLSLAAERYLREAKDKKEQWLGKKNTLWLPALAAYRALRLLHTLKPGKISELSCETWAEWADILIAHQVVFSDTLQQIVPDPSHFLKVEKDAQRSLIREAYQKAPQKVIDAFLAHAAALNDEWEFESLLERVRLCWDEKWSEALWSKAESLGDDSPLKFPILKHLLSHGGEPFAKKAEETLEAVFHGCLDRETDAWFRSSSGLAAACTLFIRFGVNFWTRNC